MKNLVIGQSGNLVIEKQRGLIAISRCQSLSTGYAISKLPEPRVSPASSLIRVKMQSRHQHRLRFSHAVRTRVRGGEVHLRLGVVQDDLAASHARGVFLANF